MTAPDVLRERTVDGIPECKVRFPATELAVATLSGLHELSGFKTNHTEGSKGKRRQRDSSPGDASAHVDVWLPSTIFRTWIVGGMSGTLMMGRGEKVSRPSFLVFDLTANDSFASSDS